MLDFGFCGSALGLSDVPLDSVAGAVAFGAASGAVLEAGTPDCEAPGATLGLVAEAPWFAVEAAGGRLEPVSAFAAKANATAKIATASKVWNRGKDLERRIYKTLVAQKPNARQPLDRTCYRPYQGTLPQIYLALGRK